MYFKSNIKFLRNRRELTQKDLALALKMKRPTLSGYENGVSHANIDVLISFSKYYNVSIDTLLKIDLTKLSNSQLSEIEKGNDVFISGTNLRVLSTSVDRENEENIELVPEKAKAGYATGFADPEYIKELPMFHLPFLSKQKKYRTFQLSGDSMLPIPNASWVTGAFVLDWNQIISGHAYIIFTLDDGIVFKIVENLIETDNLLRLYSLNPEYSPYDVHIAQIKEVWQFVHYISAELPDPVLPKDEMQRTMEKIKSDVELIKTKVMHV